MRPNTHPLSPIAALAVLLMSVAALAPVLATNAAAQRRYDERGDTRTENRFDGRSGGGRNIAGQFDYYALVMSWSPTHCASEAGERDDQQCNRRDGRGYAFVLHGLWPQYERGFPESCPTRDRPFVPDRVIDGVIDIMPSRGLAIHEYRKHGTCSGLDPAGYFDLSRQLFKSIRIPDRYVAPREQQQVAPETLVDEFVAANPGLAPDMMAVSCGGAGNRLKEIRVCFTRTGKLRACGGNENQRRMCSARTMYVPPVRGAAAAGAPRGGDRATGDRGTGGRGESRTPNR
ncbi:MAG: ribonuclease T2 family protein, partial [Hyphomicrobiaceae bacterium]